MSARRISTAVHLFTLLLSFGVGILVGQQFCLPDPEPCPETECPAPKAPVVDEFTQQIDIKTDEKPTEESDHETVADGAHEIRENRTEELPEGPPPASPAQRQQLLGWARDQSSTLESCPRDMGRSYRLAITLDLAPDGHVDHISVDTIDADLPESLTACISERVSEWQLPDDLETTQPKLMFRLTL